MSIRRFGLFDTRQEFVCSTVATLRAENGTPGLPTVGTAPHQYGSVPVLQIRGAPASAGLDEFMITVVPRESSCQLSQRRMRIWSASVGLNTACTLMVLVLSYPKLPPSVVLKCAPFTVRPPLRRTNSLSPKMG